MTYWIILGIVLTFSSVVTLAKVYLVDTSSDSYKPEIEKWGMTAAMVSVLSVVGTILIILLYLAIAHLIIPIALYLTIDIGLKVLALGLGLGIPVLISYHKKLLTKTKNLLQSKREKLLEE